MAEDKKTDSKATDTVKPDAKQSEEQTISKDDVGTLDAGTIAGTGPPISTVGDVITLIEECVDDVRNSDVFSFLEHSGELLGIAGKIGGTQGEREALSPDDKTRLAAAIAKLQSVRDKAVGGAPAIAYGFRQSQDSGSMSPLAAAPSLPGGRKFHSISGADVVALYELVTQAVSLIGRIYGEFAA